MPKRNDEIELIAKCLLESLDDIEEAFENGLGSDDASDVDRIGVALGDDVPETDGRIGGPDVEQKVAEITRSMKTRGIDVSFTDNSIIVNDKTYIIDSAGTITDAEIPGKPISSFNKSATDVVRDLVADLQTIPSPTGMMGEAKERLPWGKRIGGMEGIDPELLREPPEGRRLEDLKKVWLPLPTADADVSAEEKVKIKEREAAKHPGTGSEEYWTEEEILRALMPSIIHQAGKYATARFPMSDAVQQGLIGAMNAIRWDKGKSPFAGYAWMPITTSIRRASFEAGVVKVPEGQYKVGQDPSKGGGLFGKEQFLGYEVPGEEGAMTTAAQLLPAASRERAFIRGGGKPGEVRTATTSVEAPTSQMIDKMMFNRELLDKVLRFAKLSPVEEKVVNMIYGIEGGGKEHTTGEISAVIGKSPQRVSEIKARAMAKLVSAAKTVRALGKEYVPEQKELEQVAALLEEMVRRLSVIQENY